LIQWWIKEILQLETKVQRLFDNLGPSSLLVLTIFKKKTQTKVYKPCSLPWLLNKSCLNFQCNPNSKTSNTLLWLSNHILFSFFISFHILTYFFLVLLILSLDFCVVGYLSPMVFTSHTSQFSCKCERKKLQKNKFAPSKNPPSSKVNLLPLANENATILSNFRSSNQWPFSDLWSNDNWRGWFMN
jgi:hypothetical protein